MEEKSKSNRNTQLWWNINWPSS